MLLFEEVEKRVGEVGGFSGKLEEILLFLLKETRDIRETVKSENDARRQDIEKVGKHMENLIGAETDKLKEIIKKENEERQRDMKDIEAFVKKENAERRKEMGEVKEKLRTEEEKRLEEAKQLQEKMEKERKALQEYVERDARETKERMAAENKLLQEKLDREAAELKKKLQDGDEEKAEEMKILQQKLDMERRMLTDKMEREKTELAEEMERVEADRKKEAANLKNKIEEDAKQTQSGIVTMFERLKNENESRKTEIHGLKDILVRENEKLGREQMAMGQRLENGLVDLSDKMDKEIGECRKDLKRTNEELTDNVKAVKKEIKDKIDNEYTDLKKKVELETNEIRDKMQFDKKAMIVKFEEVEDERQKEAKLIRAQLQREREETRESISNEATLLRDQVDGNTRDLMDIIKKEKGERERDHESLKRKIDDEKQELQLSIDRDRDNMSKKLNEEHDQRRIEQMEVQQRLENTEKSGKSEMQELFGRVKRYEEEARLDNDEVRQALTRVCSSLDEKMIRDKKDIREALDHETMDLSKRVDKCNLERLNEGADIQSKLAMLGKSASRHLDNLKHQLHRESQTLLELMQKSCSVAFNAHRDEGHQEGGECYITFSSCTVNIGGGFIPKSGIFQCPEPGLYLFTLTVCTYDGKKCLLVLRKNEKDVCAMIDQDGNENRGKTMISQTCLMDLDISDRVQVYAVTGTGLSDTKSSHYTQFSGVILRPSPDTFRSAIRQAAQDAEDDVSLGEGSIRGFTPTPSNVELRAASRRTASVTRTAIPEEPKQNGVSNLPAPTQNGAVKEPAATQKKEVAVKEPAPTQNGTAKEPAPIQNGPAKEPTPIQTVLAKEPAPTQIEGVEVGTKITPVERTKKKTKEETKEEKPQQSYLALTGLGGADKKENGDKPPPASEPAAKQAVKKPEAGNAFYSFLKR